MNCKHKENCQNYQISCDACSRSYEDKFSPRELKDNECLCISCKRIIDNGEIFRYKDNPKKGLCFNCY